VKPAVLVAVAALSPLLAAGQPPPPPGSRVDPAAVGMQQMRDSMHEIRNRMDRIRATEDPAKRQRLLDEHLTALERSARDLQRLPSQAPGPVDCPRDDAACLQARTKAEQEDLRQRMELIRTLIEQVREQLRELEEHDTKRH